jgi:hypothetical protein
VIGCVRLFLRTSVAEFAPLLLPYPVRPGAVSVNAAVFSTGEHTEAGSGVEQQVNGAAALVADWCNLVRLPTFTVALRILPLASGPSRRGLGAGLVPRVFKRPTHESCLAPTPLRRASCGRA